LVASGSDAAPASALPVESPFVTSGSPLEGEQVLAAEQAKLTNPEAVAERKASQTKFENLNAEQAIALAGEKFSGLVDNRDGGPPQLQAGESITEYTTASSARVALAEGKHGLIESLAPLAVETAGGHFVPVDLGLSEVGGGFAAKTPAVAVRMVADALGRWGSSPSDWPRRLARPAGRGYSPGSPSNPRLRSWISRRPRGCPMTACSS